MGVDRYKKTAACECGCQYGSNCGRTTTYLLCYNRSCDIATLYIKEDATNATSNYERVTVLTDNQLSALIEVLCAVEHIEEIAEEERELI